MFQFSVLFALVVVNFFSADAFAKSGVLKISPHRHIAYDLEIFNPNEPTLVLLPGIYRGLIREDVFIRKLLNKKTNFLALHFSAHPASIASLENLANTSPVLLDHFFSDITSASLAKEVDFTIQSLKIVKPLIVTLSYSASISEHINPKLYPIVIDTAPMGRFDESDEGSIELLQFWQNWFRVFPIWGESYAEGLKVAAYRSYWGRFAREYASKDERLNNPMAIEILTRGYISLAMAVEGFDLRKQNFAKSPKRIFIFGSDEDPARRAIQNEALEVYQKVIREKSQAIVIEGAGHIVPNENPDSYFAVLQAIAKRVFQTK